MLSPVHTIRFLVPKIGSSLWDGLISRFRFCGENVGRSFVVCSRDPIFRSNRKFSVWSKTITGISCKICQRLSSFKKSIGWKYSIFYFHPFFKITDPCVGRSFSMCWHNLTFGTNKNQILTNGSCERAFKIELKSITWWIQWMAFRNLDITKNSNYKQLS